MAKRKVTKEDLIKYPELKEKKIQVGQEYEFTEDDETGTDDFENGDDTGGSNPPPNKGRG